MRDNKPQRCIEQHKSLKVTRNHTNRDKRINEASKQTFANNLFKISCKYMQSILSNWKICLNIINIRTDDESFNNLSIIIETVQVYRKRLVPTSKFDVRKLQKQLQSVIQIHLDQSANFGPLPLNVCVTVSHKVAFNNINH